MPEFLALSLQIMKKKLLQKLLLDEKKTELTFLKSELYILFQNAQSTAKICWLGIHPPHFLSFCIKTAYHHSPMASIFLHWLVGMVYVFYFASFVILLREVLRPGVLWFLRNLNDPDFNPIQVRRRTVVIS